MADLHLFTDEQYNEAIKALRTYQLEVLLEPMAGPIIQKLIADRLAVYLGIQHITAEYLVLRALESRVSRMLDQVRNKRQQVYDAIVGLQTDS